VTFTPPAPRGTGKTEPLWSGATVGTETCTAAVFKESTLDVDTARMKLERERKSYRECE
jgi:hypothetical protein